MSYDEEVRKVREDRIVAAIDRLTRAWLTVGTSAARGNDERRRINEQLAALDKEAP